jgi:hypothetical protein
LVLGLVMLPLAAAVPAARATGAGGCAIGGTISFARPASASPQGRWSIDDGVINCVGLYNGYYRFNGPGTFTGSGTYTVGPLGAGTCGHVGSGTVDYRFPTTVDDIHLVEPLDYLLLGTAGALSTPSLRGVFQVSPPYDGDCVTRPLTRAAFVAQAVLIRFYPPDPDRILPKKPKSSS